MRTAIESAVPHGRTDNGGRNDRGAWADPPAAVADAWASLAPRLDALVEKHPALRKANHLAHLGTLGTGNHFIEVCLDEEDSVWLMLHSGSRGVGNQIGTYFIELAREDMRRHFINLPDADLAYLPEGTKHFDDYVEGVSWAQEYAMTNRRLMMANVIAALRTLPGLKPFTAGIVAVNCHHNYVEREHHYGKDVFVTRKGAVRARKGDLGVIPGSMGTRSYIVRGLGNPESFDSCSHGAGRAMSRTEARRRFTVADHVKATAGIECRKDEDVIDETPAAYKSIDAVMAGAARPRGGGPHAPPGRLREGMTSLVRLRTALAAPRARALTAAVASRPSGRPEGGDTEGAGGSQALRCGSGPAAPTGSRISTSSPPPGRFRASTRPPCAAIARRAIARPRPKPGPEEPAAPR